MGIPTKAFRPFSQLRAEILSDMAEDEYSYARGWTVPPTDEVDQEIRQDRIISAARKFVEATKDVEIA